MHTDPITAAELVVAPSGRIYHLDLFPDEIAEKIIIVGDPDRVPVVAELGLATVEIERFHRGLRTITGVTPAGMRLSIVTSGMGTPSLEIVLGELIALNEIDFATRRHRGTARPLSIIRVGTSGALDERTPLGTPIITEYAVGLDNTGLFYDVPSTDALRELELLVDGIVDRRTRSTARFKGRIRSYAAQASPLITAALSEAASTLGISTVSGITVSNAGFFGNQGRDIHRTAVTVPEIDSAFSEARFRGLRFENMEMEASLLCHLAAGQGYNAGAVCCVVANRAKDTFASDIPRSVEDATRIALAALETLHLRSRTRPSGS